MIGHLYVVWIHPFNEGNGRTARLLEYELLLHGGMPRPALHLLNNHYSRTRGEYEKQLKLATVPGGDLTSFAVYALDGLLSELKRSLAGRTRDEVTAP